MTPLEKRVQYLEDIIGAMVASDRYLIQRDLQLFDGRDIQLALGRGTKIGTSTSQKLGFWNVTPVDQPATVADPSGGVTVDAEARTAIIAVIDRLQESGMIA